MLSCFQRDRELEERSLAAAIHYSLRTTCGGGGEKTVEHGGEKLKPDPVPAHKAQGYVRGMGAIIALPKNKRGKMTVEDTVTKSSTGQIGGPAL